MARIGRRVLCEKCGWYGKQNELEWSPFNPVDTFLGIDARENPDNVIKFKERCPNCKTDEEIVFT